jgi:beta-lactam-binding protein with PASTA domain
MTLSDALMNAATGLAAWLVLSLATGAALCWFINRAKQDRRPTVADIQRMRAAQAAAEAEAEAAIYGDVPALNGTIGDRNG